MLGKMLDIAFEHIRVSAGKALGAVQRGVRALAHPAGVGIVDKARSKSGSIRLHSAW